MAPFKVLIAGAGIGGPALALWLARIGCDITIVERDPKLRTTGQQIDLRGQGIVIMKMMGIENSVRASLCSEPGMRFIDHRGKSKAFFKANKSGTGTQSGTSEYEIMRGDLVRILFDATKNLKGVKYVFGCYIKDFTQDEGSSGGKVHVTFSDGRQDYYDLLVGADGIGSATRRLMLGPSFPDPRHDLGCHMSFFTAPSIPGDSTDATVCHIPGGKFVITRKDKPDNIRVYLASRGNCETVDAAKSLAEQKTALVELFKGAEGSQLDRFLKDLQESPMADDLYSQHMNQIRLPEGAWSRGRVVLLGDAAYCPTPFGGGTGTTAAIIGAYVLAGEVAKRWKGDGQLGTSGIEEAGKEYERIVRPFIMDKQNVPPWIIRAVFPQTKLGIWAFQTIMWLIIALRIEKLFLNLAMPEESRKLQYPDYFGLKGADKDE
ncbi:putative monooxygenase [Whalleya microplaca]|nr:putative monooxygenase [Whalleya microplaca]